jgi:hypothetical protein
MRGRALSTLDEDFNHRRLRAQGVRVKVETCMRVASS